MKITIADKSQLRAELQRALATYRGPVTRCSPGRAAAPRSTLEELQQRLDKDEARASRLSSEDSPGRPEPPYAADVKVLRKV